MTGLLIFGIILLLGIIVVQIGKVTELAAKIRGREAVQLKSTQTQAYWLVIFMIVFLVLCVWSAWHYRNMMLGYGPLIPASAHGGDIDNLFNVTLFFTGIVFILTHIVLFWFAYKYRKQEGRVGTFFVHSNKLEAIWTIIPAVVMVVLVTQGLVVWNEVMPDVGPDDEFIEVEATGWTDEKNIDDFHATELWLPVGKQVRVRITSKDVLHNFYLPHFRVKMDAIPGLPTYFIFTPTVTTEEYRENLAQYPEWNTPYDLSEPDGGTRAEEFNFELACAELCGKGHYSMKKIVKIVTQEEYDAWCKEQPSYFKSNIRGTEDDPYGRLMGYEAKARAAELLTDVESALIKDDPSVDDIRLNSDVNIELSGHTDSTGNADANQLLSQARANSVVSYLVGKGIDASRLRGVGLGSARPADTNETPEGRQNNRRIEMKILSQVL